jgi:hypothetical protein
MIDPPSLSDRLLDRAQQDSGSASSSYPEVLRAVQVLDKIVVLTKHEWQQHLVAKPSLLYKEHNSARQQIEQPLQIQSHMNPHRTSEDDFFTEISQVQDADYHTGSEHFLEDIEAEFQQFPPQSLEEFGGHEDDDDFLESQFAHDSMNQRKTPSNLDISEEDFQNGILWTWWDMLGVRRQTQMMIMMMMMMAKTSGVSRARNFLRKKDPTKHPQRIAAGLISSTLIRKLYFMLHPTTLN